jgi:hypothetical protein
METEIYTRNEEHQKQETIPYKKFT